MSVIVPINYSGAAVDLSTRYAGTTTVVASPALAAETIIATVVIPNNIAIQSGVRVYGWAAFTVGTSGTAVTLRIRRTSVSGTLVVSSGGLTVSAASLYAFPVQGFDSNAPAGTTYELTMQVANGAAASTVSAVLLDATPI